MLLVVTFQVFVVTTTVIFSLPLLRSMGLRAATTVSAGQKRPRCLACAVRWQGGFRRAASSLPVVNECKLITPFLFPCSHLVLSFPKGRPGGCVPNRQAQSPFPSSASSLGASDSQTSGRAGVRALQGRCCSRSLVGRAESPRPRAPLLDTGFQLALPGEEGFSSHATGTRLGERLMCAITLLYLFYPAGAWPRLPRAHPLSLSPFSPRRGPCSWLRFPLSAVSLTGAWRAGTCCGRGRGLAHRAAPCRTFPRRAVAGAGAAVPELAEWEGFVT